MVLDADQGSTWHPYIRPYFCAYAWGSGTMRERRSGVWEIRVAVGVEPVSGRTVQRSFTFHGCAEGAELHPMELAAEWAERRAVRRAAPFLTVGELLERWLCAHHDWRPASWIGARPNVKALSADRLAMRRVSTLKPEHVRAAVAVWSSAGASVAVSLGASASCARPSAGRMSSASSTSTRSPPCAGRSAQVLDSISATRKCSVCSRPPTRSLPALTCGMRSADTSPSRSGSLSASPRTRERGAASWSLFASTTWRGACSPLSEASRPMCSGPPRRAGPVASLSGARRSSCGGRARRPGPADSPTVCPLAPGSSPPSRP